MHQHMLDQLAELKLKGFKEAFIRQHQNPDYLHMPFEERVAHLIDAEVVSRKNERLKRYLRASQLKYKDAFLSDIEYTASRNLQRQMIASLTTNQWIEQARNIIITGATGTGKTYIACALAHNAMASGYNAWYARIAKLLAEIKLARADGSYLSFLKKMTRVRLLILDDLGVSPMDVREAQELLEVIEERTGFGSIIVTFMWAGLFQPILDCQPRRSQRPKPDGKNRSFFLSTIFIRDCDPAETDLDRPFLTPKIIVM